MLCPPRRCPPPRIRNRAGAGLAATALLGLAALPAQAATFSPVTVDDLVTAINTANTNGTDDTIDLGGRTFTLTTYLPEIQPSGSLKIHNGTLARDPNSSELFRVLGISSGSTFTLERVTLTGGSLPGTEDTFGGGLGARNSTVQIIDSTITGNFARYGGGIAQGEFGAGGGLVTITNSTISNNQAAAGGGISVVNSELQLVTSTVVDNAAGTGGSSGDNGAFFIQAGNVRMTRSISAGGCEIRNGGSFVSGGYNVATNKACGALNAIGDVPDVDVKYGPLANNGGPTKTHALLAGSPAQDRAPNGNCAGETDQRGLLRPSGSGCDSGAFERQFYTLNLSRTGTGSGKITSELAGIDCGTDCTEVYPEGTSITLTATPDAGSSFNRDTAGWSNGPCDDRAETCRFLIRNDLTFSAQFDRLAPDYLGTIQQPINADGSSTFNSKKGVVPVKFRLTADGAATCTLPPATIRVMRTTGDGGIGEIDESTYLHASDSGSNFRIQDCQYHYNVNAKAFGKGEYTVELLIGGVSEGIAAFELK